MPLKMILYLVMKRAPSAGNRTGPPTLAPVPSSLPSGSRYDRRPSTSISSPGSRLGVKILGCKHNITVHPTSCYTQHHSTHNIRVHTTSRYTQHQSTHSIRVHTTSEYTQHHGTHSIIVHTASEYTQHHGTHSIRVHTAVEKYSSLKYSGLSDNQTDLLHWWQSLALLVYRIQCLQVHCYHTCNYKTGQHSNL